MYSLYHSWKPPPGAKIFAPGQHQAAYQEHLKEQAVKASQNTQVEQIALLSHNREGEMGKVVGRWGRGWGDGEEGGEGIH